MTPYDNKEDGSMNVNECIEQIKEILAGAPDNAVYHDGIDYSDEHGRLWDAIMGRWYACGHFARGTALDTYRTIIAQYEEIAAKAAEIERLKTQVKKVDMILYHVDTGNQAKAYKCLIALRESKEKSK